MRAQQVNDAIVIRGLRALSAASTDADFELPPHVRFEVYHPATERKFVCDALALTEGRCTTFYSEDGCLADASNQVYHGPLERSVIDVIAEIYCDLDHPKGHYNEEWRARFGQHAPKGAVNG